MAEPTEGAESSDPFDRIIECLNKHGVDFLMVGGWAVIYHGFNRSTDDMDIFIRRTEENARRTVAALEEAGLGCAELAPDVFTQDNGISLGEAPLKVDILSVLPGVSFDDAWARRTKDLFGPNSVINLSNFQADLKKAMEDMFKVLRAIPEMERRALTRFKTVGLISGSVETE